MRKGKILFLILLIALFISDSQRHVKPGDGTIPQAEAGFFLIGRISVERADGLEEFLRECWADPEVSIIRIDIQSNGGSLYATIRLCLLMQEIEKDKIIVTVAREVACSGAAMLLACGTPGYRFIEPETRVMIHSSTLHLQKGWYTPEQIWDEWVEAKIDQTISYWWIARLSGQSFFRVTRDCHRKDFYFSPEQAIDYGLADYLTETDSNK